MDDGLSTVHVRLRIIRPDGYPLLDVPKFEFLDHHAMPTLLRKRLYRVGVYTF